MEKENRIQKKGDDFLKIRLTDIQADKFQKALKRGIYKELCRRDMLTVSQLNDLLDKI